MLSLACPQAGMLPFPSEPSSGGGASLSDLFTCLCLILNSTYSSPAPSAHPSALHNERMRGAAGRLLWKTQVSCCLVERQSLGMAAYMEVIPATALEVQHGAGLFLEPPQPTAASPSWVACTLPLGFSLTLLVVQFPFLY